MKLCVNCKYNVRKHWCKHPANGISHLDGEPVVVFAATNRKPFFVPENKLFAEIFPQPACGTDAILFEQKDTEQSTSIIWKILSVFGKKKREKQNPDFTNTFNKFSDEELVNNFLKVLHQQMDRYKLDLSNCPSWYKVVIETENILKERISKSES